MSRFQLDIITPTSIKSFSDVAYLRMPGLDGLIGVQSKHANSIIALDVGEIKITINGKDQYFATSGGFSDIKKESVQLLLETVESVDNIDKDNDNHGNSSNYDENNYINQHVPLPRLSSRRSRRRCAAAAVALCTRRRSTTRPR